ncbi:hypothetical protein ACFXC9_07570 [Streptomyces naganishii]|uniref:hypothetical protein n=1 Tax=Streptomyces naganishii TaxID=285447 RepID=UPI0036B44F6D
MQVDDAGAIRPNSVLMDNTTLFTCLPMASEPVRRECYWATKEWADDLIDRGMSNLVESLILHEAVYVDGERGYHAPVVEEISELFPGLLRGVGIGADREQVLRRLSEAMSGGEELDRGLYSIAFHASRSRRTGEPLHLSHIYGFLHEEMQRAGLPGYAPEPGRTDPMVFRTFFYLALAARTGLPYTPYSLRNPILLALSERGLTHLVGGRPRQASWEYYAEIAKKILWSFDDQVRRAFSDRLQEGPVSLPALPMPGFWEIIRERAQHPAAVAEQVLELRERAAPYREYVGQLSAAYESGDLLLLRRQQELLADLMARLGSAMRVPRVEWKRVVVPVRVKSPFLELDQVSFRVPAPSRFRGPQFAFLHDWTTRRL